MLNGFVKVAAATPNLKVADCEYNSEQIIKMITEAEKNKASLIVFPELSITGYTCGDLFLQKALLNSAKEALNKIKKATKKLNIISVIGLPIANKTKIFNCAAVLLKGEAMCFVPKSHIPNYAEFNEVRYFSTINQAEIFDEFNYEDMCYLNKEVVFVCNSNPDFSFGVEICEDLWQPNSPSEKMALNGANIICNLSASPEAIGKDGYRRDLVKVQSGKLSCAYILANAGFGESTTDLVYSGHNIVAENGIVLKESNKFTNGIIYTDIDLERLSHEKRRLNTFAGNADDDMCRYEFDFELPEIQLERKFSKTPFVPVENADLSKVCSDVFALQAVGLATRLKATGINKVVLGLSGGLDSTLAMIATVSAFEMLCLDKKGIIAVTMPCFGTTSRTKDNAEKIAQAFGTTFLEIDIKDAVLQHFKDIEHDENTHDTTYENSQARERTQVLMDLANKYNALVVGTGDLSEAALGFATYNGDHMSMYAINSSVPKTLIRYLVKYKADNSNELLQSVLLDVLNTPVSPELLPPSEDGKIKQKTEEIIGPYILHDFFLYYFIRFGYTPKRILELAAITFKDDYSKDNIKNYLRIFIKRFFNNQFKRSCMPDGPKIGSVSLSPRGDFIMPSDAVAKIWLKELE